MRSPPTTQLRGLLLIACCLSLAGCFAGNPIVEGAATFDGAPIDGGALTLDPLPGTAGRSVGTTISGGKYKLSGAAAPALGKYRVVIRWVRKTGRMVPIPTNPNGSERMEEIGETLPVRYNDQSTLEIEVKQGVNRANWQLTSS